MTTLPISLSPGFSILVNKGDTVKTGDILAKKEATHEIRLVLPTILHTTIKKTAKLLRKYPGDKVQKGDVLAAKKKTLGLSEEVIQSEVDGTVIRYDRATGTLVLFPDTGGAEGGVNEIVCPIDGTVEVCDNDRILLTTDKDVLQASGGTGGEVRGEVQVVTSGQEHVQLHQLDTSVLGKIILGGIFDRDTLVKAVGMGTQGVIAAAIREEDLLYLHDRQMETPVITVGQEGYDRLKAWNGKNIYLQGANKTVLLLHL